MKLVPATFADRLDIEVREKTELRPSSRFLVWPMHQSCYYLLEWKRPKRSRFGVGW